MPDHHPTIEPYPGRDDRDGFLVRTPYSDAFIEALKAQLPRQDRYWVADSSAWWIADDGWGLLTYLLLEHFGEYSTLDPDTGALDYVSSEGGRARQGAYRL